MSRSKEGGLDSRQLTWLMGSDDSFLGVFAADQLPFLDSIVRPSGLIVNSDPISKPGTHWLAMYYGADGHDEFFDSYGQSPSSYQKAWIDHLNPGFQYSRKRLQSDDTSVCGHYCVYYLKQKRKGSTLDTIVKPFTGLKRVNDRKICHWVCRNPRLLKSFKARAFCQSSVCGREGTRRRLNCC